MYRVSLAHLACALLTGLSVPLNGCGPGAAPSELLPDRMVPRSQVAQVTAAARSAQNARNGSGEDFIAADRPRETMMAPPRSKTKETGTPEIVINPALVSHPSAFRLAAKAEALGKLKKKPYRRRQRKWVSSGFPACNFFLITALCESGYCQKSVPLFRAATFDQYFLQTGWKKITLPELRSRAMAGAPMDVVFQKAGVTTHQAGHVMVFLRYNVSEHTVTVAEGDFGRVLNEVVDLPEERILDWEGAGYTIFVRE